MLLFAVAHAGELRVAAAASLAEAVTEIAKHYEAEHATKVTPVFAASNVLARQIESGAPVDVFLSADERTIDGLVKGGHIGKDSVKPLLSNALVVVVPADATRSIASANDLTGLSRLALGDPAAVPAGVYAKAWLSKAGQWDALQAKCVGTESVRAALATVEAGNADAAIVYRTDAAVSSKVKIAFTVPAAETPAIVYPAAVCARSHDAAAAKKFVDFLGSEKAAAIFRKRGFTVIQQKAKGE